MMKTLNVSISDAEYDRLGIKGNQLSFSDIMDMLKRELGIVPEIREHDMVASIATIENVPLGTLGSVVHVYPGSTVFEVEFIVDGKSRVETALRTQLEKKVADAGTE